MLIVNSFESLQGEILVLLFVSDNIMFINNVLILKNPVKSVHAAILALDSGSNLAL